MLSGSRKAPPDEKETKERAADTVEHLPNSPKSLHHSAQDSTHHTIHHEKHHITHHPRTHHPRHRYSKEKRRLDNFVYGTAVVALLILAMFFSDNLGLMFIPIVAIIILLITYEILAHDIGNLEARVERFILITVIFLLFVTWGLFTLSQKIDQVLLYQGYELGPALEEFQRWSQTRGLIQPAHVGVQVNSDDGAVVVGGNISWSGLRGPSMEPTIFPGNTLLLRVYTPDTELNEGQIIRFIHEDRTYVHRVLAVYVDEIITQGDNSDKTESISRKDITHVVVGVLYT